MTPYAIRRTDKNQQEIMDALRQIGASVLPLHTVGHGCPDLAVGFRGDTYFLEVKSSKGKLTQAEKMFFAQWEGRAAVVRSVDEALRAIGAME